MKRALVVAFVSLTMPACFGGYDSRWGQTKAAQQRSAQATAPSSLRAASSQTDDPAAPAPRAASARVQKLRMVAYVTRTFTAQVVDTPRHMREMLEDANKVTERDLGIHIELVETRMWQPTNEDDIDRSFDELRSSESGQGVDWVAGFVGALPRATQQFHDAGRGSMKGKHLLLRAPDSARRHDGIEKAFDELSEEQRRVLEKKLRRHRAAALFLHEIGHTLGADHAKTEDSIMFPAYNKNMAAFDGPTVDMMRATLTAGPDAREPKRVAAGGAARAAPSAAAAPTTPAAPATPATPEVPETPELTGAARDRYADAYRASQRGDVVGAWNLLKPLFDTQAKSMAVQDLRCRVATSSMEFSIARKQCEPLMKLSTAVPGK